MKKKNSSKLSKALRATGIALEVVGLILFIYGMYSMIDFEMSTPLPMVLLFVGMGMVAGGGVLQGFAYKYRKANSDLNSTPAEIFAPNGHANTYEPSPSNGTFTDTGMCPMCGANIPSGASFCLKCGTKVSNVCPKCHAVNPSDSSFCGRCGEHLTGGDGK